MENFPYYPGSQPSYDLPLGRFLPPLNPGVITRWLQKTTEPGGWIIDPLGANPALALEAARAGYRVLVTCNNPVLKLMLEVLAEAPTFQQMQSLLAELADLKKGEDRLETFIQSQYVTLCPACGKTVPAQAFLWRKGEVQPFKRRVHCGKCGGDGEFEIRDSDLQNLPNENNSALNKAWALSRLGELSEEETSVAKDALEIYPSRALSILLTLISRSESLALDLQQRRWLDALLLSACDAGNSMWPNAGGTIRPRKLSVPGIFLEMNLWDKLEQAVQDWSSQSDPVSLSHFPELPPPSGGICLTSTRLRGLLPLPDRLQTRNLASVFPRANPAFWILTTMWSGWLLGKNSVSPMKSSLERQHYDWHWHAHAIRNTFSSFLRVAQDVNLLIMAPELTQSFLLSLLLGGQAAGFGIQALNLRVDQEDIQIHFHPSKSSREIKGNEIKPIIREAVTNHLKQKGEPANYGEIYAVSLSTLIQLGRLFKDPLELPADLQNLVEGSLQEILHDADRIRQYGTGSFESERTWWVVDESGCELPITDRVEMTLVNLLRSQPSWQVEALEAALCSAHPGFATPGNGLFKALLESYTELSSSNKNEVILRSQDSEEKRESDLLQAKERLGKLANQMGFIPQGLDPILWLDKEHKPVFAFYLVAYGIISPMVFTKNCVARERCIIVTPGGRAGLLGFKLHRNLRLAEAAEGWHYLKYRYLKELSLRAEIDTKNWIAQLDGDPLEWSPPKQISILANLNESEF